MCKSMIYGFRAKADENWWWIVKEQLFLNLLYSRQAMYASKVIHKNKKKRTEKILRNKA